MAKISYIKENVGGVEDVFLIKDKKLVDTLSGRDLTYISKSISYLAEVILERKDLSKISLIADKTLQLYLFQNYILGVITTKNVNLPLLNLISNKLLQEIGKTGEIISEEISEGVRDYHVFKFKDIVFESDEVFASIRQRFKSKKNQLVLWCIQEEKSVEEILRILKDDFPDEEDTNRDAINQVVSFLEALDVVERR
ncbi:MAG: hypothetical protein ACE5K0_08285 [Candidatus Methanofastidiosia archaeon]